MGYDIGPKIIDVDGNPHHVEISSGRICVWNKGESGGLFLSYAEALKLADSIRLHLQVYTDMEIE